MYELQLASFSGSPSSPNAKLALLAPDGSAYDFKMQSGGTFVPDTTTGAYYAPTNLKVEYLGTLPSDLSTLQFASTQWRVTDSDDTVWTFQTFTRPNTSTPYAVGRPISRVTRDGYRWDFAYRSDNSLQTVTDSFGRQATFNWSMFYTWNSTTPPSNMLPYPEAVSSISLPDGTSLRYTYDPPPATAPPSTSQIQRLIKVERLDSIGATVNSTTYAYADPRFPTSITSITDFNGDQIATYMYDADGRAISSTHASGADAYALSNTDTSTEHVTLTNPLGKVEDYHFPRYNNNAQDIRFGSIVGQASLNTATSSQSVTYGSDAFVATETDEEGHLTSYTRDSRGRPTTIVEAYGTPQQRSTTITWDAMFNVPDRIVQPGLQTDYTYTTSGQLQTVTEIDTTTQSIPYSTNGQTRTWTYSWRGGGRLDSINGPKPIDTDGKDDTLTFTYDAAGNLQTSTNGLGQTTTFANYDANGRPGTMTDPNGIVTAFTYDVLGRTNTITVKDPNNSGFDATTSFDYDIHDRVTGITLPATDKLFIDYDTAGRVQAIRAASGERVDYTTDAEGNVTGESIKRADASVARSVARSFDELGRLLTETLGPGRTTTQAYDKVGNQTKTTSPMNRVTQAAFDPLNRLVSTIAPDSGTSTTGYNALDQVTSFADPISVQTTYVRDGFGDVIQEVSPDRGTSTYYYDQAGEMTASIDGRGQRVDYTRDILGRVTQKTPAGRPASEAIAYIWDTPGITGSYGAGRLSSVTDGTGTTSFAYDSRGNLITKRQTIGSVTADLGYTYDLADRVTQISYPSGRMVAYTRDSKGRVAAVQTKASVSDPNWVTLASAVTYDPWGSITGAQFGNGLALQETWRDGLLASNRLYNSSSGADLSSLAYIYDNDGNIGSINDLLNPGSSVYYGYDANDRLTFASMAVAAPTTGRATYSYASGTNQLASLTDASGTRSISYDGRGNTIGESRPRGVAVSASYDGYGRLLTYTRTGDPAQTNIYNGLDDRVSVTSGSTTNEFVYDPDGRLLGEYDASGAPVAETIWLSPDVANDNQPFGGDDGIGGYAPLVVVTGSGSNAALYWVHGNHLGVPLVVTDSTGASASPPAYTMAGYPGQTQSLSDLYYNRYRDYDSSLGRYIQADPLGLGGGSNPYVYANNNPLRWTDPSGKCIEDACIIESIAIGAAIGAGIDLGIQALNNWYHDRDVLNPHCYNWTEAGISGLLGAFGGGFTAAGEAAAAGAGAASDGFVATAAETTEEAAGDALGNGDTYLYQKLGPGGDHLKYGITKDPLGRYTADELGGGRLKILAQGSRKDMLQLERNLHETLPIGPEEGQSFYIQKQIEKGLVPPPYAP